MLLTKVNCTVRRARRCRYRNGEGGRFRDGGSGARLTKRSAALLVCLAPVCLPEDLISRRLSLPATGDRRFESISLQRRVCEPSVPLVGNLRLLTRRAVGYYCAFQKRIGPWDLAVPADPGYGGFLVYSQGHLVSTAPSERARRVPSRWKPEAPFGRAVLQARRRGS